MRFASIAVLLLLTAACGHETAGTPAARSPQSATTSGSASPAGEPAAPPKPLPAAPAAETPHSEAPPTAEPVAEPDVPATPRPRPVAAPASSSSARVPPAAPAPKPAGGATQAPAATPAGEPVAPAVPPPTAGASAAPHAAASAPAASPPAAPAQIAPIAPAVTPEPLATAPELDLQALQDRLRQTKAIGFMTKLTLKGQVDDLLGRFHDHYRGKTKETMKELRRAYDLLMMKVLSLLQDADQQLASAIVASREAIWGLLADPVKFETLQG